MAPSCVQVVLLTLLATQVNAQVVQQFFEYLDSFGGCEPWLPKHVTVKQGTLKGATMTSGKGRYFCAFRRVPYSQPPVGEYRFKDPRPPQNWTGVLDATKETPQCLHVEVFTTNLQGQEDCLYLGVFTPRRKLQDGKLLDVLVYIYPGEFYFGSSSDTVTGPHFFMDYDLLVVYIGFRTGALGFLSTGDDESPGNYGLKDQVAALHWVQENIASFGGNPNSVTLMGHSAGGCSAHLHMLSPLSKGLFHRVISMEGTAIHPWARNPNPLQQAQRQAHAVNCPTEPTSKLVACLRELDAANLTLSVYKLIAWWVLPGPGYSPVVEKKTELNQNAFLTVDPLELLRTGQFEHVPWMIGGVPDGGSLFLAGLYTLDILHKQALSNPEILKRKILYLNVSVPQDDITNVSNKIIDYYGGPDNVDPQLISKMMTDRLLIHSVHKTVQLQALAGHTDIYKYNLAYKGFYSQTEAFTFQDFGTSHGDIFFYLFNMFEGKLKYPPGHPDLEVRELVLSMWTNFIKYGNPTPENAGQEEYYLEREVKWYPVGNVTLDNLHIRYFNIGQIEYYSEHPRYLDLGRGRVKVNMGVDLFKTHMDFWDSLPLNENCLSNCSKVQ